MGSPPLGRLFPSAFHFFFSAAAKPIQLAIVFVHLLQLPHPPLTPLRLFAFFLVFSGTGILVTTSFSSSFPGGQLWSYQAL